MDRVVTLKSGIALALVFAATLLLGYPLASALQHGLYPRVWPYVGLTEWLGFFRGNHSEHIFEVYALMARGVSPWFDDGGTYHGWAIFSPFIVSVVVAMTPRKVLVRARHAIYGDARFATSREMARLRSGIELGIDTTSGSPVRVTVQSSLLSVAPPRSGKSTGLIIPNLAYLELHAWGGPAIVFDPKGEIYLSVSDRRRALGRKVVCLDPLGLVGGTDQWNPLADVDANDVLYLQRTARALLPGATARDGNGRYFENRAVDLLTGIFVAALSEGQATAQIVNAFLTDRPRLKTALIALRANTAARRALEIIEADPKTADPIISTAAQAFGWLSDERTEKLVSGNTFDLNDVAKGNLDIFVTFPSEVGEELAPFLRWFLMDLFSVARRQRLEDRVLLFVDEAGNLGRFDELLRAASELPGRGISLWTFWQTRSQIVDLYGENAAKALINLAEIVTVSNFPPADPDELEYWSRTLGDFTGLVDNMSTDSMKKTSVSQTSQPVRLKTATELASFDPNKLIVLSNSAARTKHPMILSKTVPHEEKRFRRFIQNTPPVRAT